MWDGGAAAQHQLVGIGGHISTSRQANDTHPQDAGEALLEERNEGPCRHIRGYASKGGLLLGLRIAVKQRGGRLGGRPWGGEGHAAAGEQVRPEGRRQHKGHGNCHNSTLPARLCMGDEERGASDNVADGGPAIGGEGGRRRRGHQAVDGQGRGIPQQVGSLLGLHSLWDARPQGDTRAWGHGRDDERRCGS